MTAAAAPWRDGERVRVAGWRGDGTGLPLGTEGEITQGGDFVCVPKSGRWTGPAGAGLHAWERVPAEPPAPKPEPVLHVRGDQLPLLLEVVAAARAWAEWWHGPSPDGASRRLSDAVAAYERAIGDGA